MTNVTARRMAVLVLGMHRSGTNAVTRVLNFLGCRLPQHVLGATPTNPDGDWEPLPVAELNDALLAEIGSAWNEWRPIQADWALARTYEANVQRAQRIIDVEYGDAPLFVLQDPRVCRLAPLWLEALERSDVTCAIVIPVQDANEVASSLHKRDALSLSAGRLLWLRHFLDAERFTRGCRRVFISHEGVLADSNGLAQRMSEALDITWPGDPEAFRAAVETFVSADLRHHVSTLADESRNPVGPWIDETQAILSEWAAHGEQESAWCRLDAIRQAFDEAGPDLITAMGDARASLRDLGIQIDELATLWSAATAGAVRWRNQAAEATETASAAQHAAARLRETVERDRIQMREVKRERDAERQRARELTAELVSLRRSGTTAAPVPPQQSQQLARMRRELRDLQTELEARGAVESLMRQVAATLSRPVKWWIDLLPQAWVRKYRLRELQRKAIFDAEAYRRRYPDVSRAGMDPLQHYVLHGVDEGRHRM